MEEEREAALRTCWGRQLRASEAAKEMGHDILREHETFGSKRVVAVKGSGT